MIYRLRDEFGEPLVMPSGRKADVIDELMLQLYVEAGDRGLTDEEHAEKLFAIIGDEPSLQAAHAREYLARHGMH